MSRNGPIQWRPRNDAEVLKAIERQAKLHEDWREAQREAQRAVEAIAGAQAASDEARSDALAAGKDDPGPVDTTELEAAAAAAVERRDLLASAFAKSRATALALADERSAAWTTEAERALGRVTGSLLGAVDALEATFAAWTEARAEVMLARDERLRERGRQLTATMTVDRLRAANGEAMALPLVVEALRALVETTPAPGAEPEPEAPQPLSKDERRALVAEGAEIYGPRAG